jgi:hypothetical protein
MQMGREELRTIGKRVQIILRAGNRHLVNPDGTTIITGLEPYIKIM